MGPLDTMCRVTLSARVNPTSRTPAAIVLADPCVLDLKPASPGVDPCHPTLRSGRFAQGVDDRGSDGRGRV